jgi:hypothetical protein
MTEQDMTEQDWLAIWPSVQLAGWLSHAAATQDHKQIVELIASMRGTTGTMGERGALQGLTGLRDAAREQLTLAGCAIEIVETCIKLADEAAMAAIVLREKGEVFT